MKVGDLVKAAYVRGSHPGIFHSGVIVEIEKMTNLFSEKYTITETTTLVRVLSKDMVMTFDLSEDKVEVISET